MSASHPALSSPAFPVSPALYAEGQGLSCDGAEEARRDMSRDMNWGGLVASVLASWGLILAVGRLVLQG